MIIKPTETESTGQIWSSRTILPPKYDKKQGYCIEMNCEMCSIYFIFRWIMYIFTADSGVK